LEKFIITGDNRLRGDLTVKGAKNAVLPILAACLLSNDVCVLNNVPNLQDVSVMCELLKSYGAKISREARTLTVDSRNISGGDAPADVIKKMRASNLVLGPILSRFHQVRLPFPGGCAIGMRPMNYHLKALQALGADLREKGGFIEAYTTGLYGCGICLDFPSVGATENIMMAASLAYGTTVLSNAAREPEIIDLADFLKKLGAKIKGAGSDIIVIEGVSALHGGEYTVMPDRIEAGTFLIAAAMTGGDIYLRNAKADDLTALIAKLREAGATVQADNGGIRLQSRARLKSVDIQTMPYSGFPTDLQAQFMALMTTAQGSSVISENVFENRFKHAEQLCLMNADINILGRAAVVKGVPNLNGAVVNATDLRAGAALVIAGLAARGETVVKNVFYIDRGYENIEESFNVLGGNIKRVKSLKKAEHVQAGKKAECVVSL
jgi:UDP-N-acetylglucosamine 1-carboxyvinyltransferase